MGEDTDLSAKDIEESVARASEEYEIPKQVEVLLDAPQLKKKKRCNDLEIALKRRLNNVKRENQVYVHKVHILCWIAHGTYVNSVLNSPELLAIALSLIPSDKCYPPKRMNLEYLEKLMGWFGKKVKLKKDSVEKFPDLSTSLQTQFQKLEAENKTNFCFLFICFLRALGLQCRLVVNLNVAPIKPPSDQLLPINPKKEENTPSTSKAKPSTSKKSKTPEKSKPSEEEKVKNEKSSSKKSKTPEKSKRSEPEKMKIEKSSSKKSKTAEKSKQSEPEKMKNEKSTSNSKKSKNEKDTKSEKKTVEATRRSTRVTKSTSKLVEESPSKSKSKRCEPSVDEMSTSDDSDFEETFVTPKKKIDRRVLSPKEEANESKSVESKTKKCGANYWLEVFLEMEEKWFCVDIVKKSYHCTKELYNAASHPVRYVLAWNNNKSIKDVTRRYVPQYLTVTKKLRVDENWWVRTMKPYQGPNTPQNREEDEELERKLEEQPLPTSISEYKNHPLYALQRHLLKFQGIYPADAPTLGFIRGEPVYSRQCVHQLHGREMWIKEAKVVKMNEKPYKIVKGRPQRNKFGNQEPPKDLELFGAWQVEDYVPPTAENGKVPRNPFGNVELFKPSMLPKGTVYLQLPGLQKIANKLSIDCAQAIVGFEYSTNGWSYPVKDGYVICEEFKDIIIDAYNQELQEAERKERQKREERVFGNWKRLIKGLFIREKLKRKYNFGDPSSSSKTDK